MKFNQTLTKISEAMITPSTTSAVAPTAVVNPTTATTAAQTTLAPVQNNTAKINELQNLITESDSENESHWAKSVLEFLVAEAPNPTSNCFEAGDLDTRLVGCDSELNKFFERKCANVDGKRKQDYSSTSSIRGQDNSGCIKE